MAQQHRLHRMFVALVLLVASAACSPCASLSSYRVVLPDRPIEISQEAAQRFQAKLTGGWEPQEQGQFRLQFTDIELTSFLNYQLKGTGFVPLSEPRVWLTRGDIYVSGALAAGELPVKGQVSLVLSPRLTDGIAELQVEKASIGPAPIPRAVLRRLEETINASLRQAQLDTEIERVQILEGEAVVVAKVK